MKPSQDVTNTVRARVRVRGGVRVGVRLRMYCH